MKTLTRIYYEQNGKLVELAESPVIINGAATIPETRYVLSKLVGEVFSVPVLCITRVDTTPEPSTLNPQPSTI